MRNFRTPESTPETPEIRCTPETPEIGLGTPETPETPEVAF